MAVVNAKKESNNMYNIVQICSRNIGEENFRNIYTWSQFLKTSTFISSNSSKILLEKGRSTEEWFHWDLM